MIDQAGDAGALAAPANDDFADAIDLPGDLVQATGSNVEATHETGEPEHSSWQPGNASVWWKWTASADGRVVVTTDGSTFDTILAVYTGSDVAALTAVASDTGYTSMQASVDFDATAGTSYSIAVDGLDGATGAVVLTLATEPPNDDFADAAVLTEPCQRFTTSSFGASEEVGEPDHGGLWGERSVWFRWTAPADGQVFVLAWSDFTALLSVYTGDAVDNLTLVGEDNSSLFFDAEVYFTATAGTTYSIALDGLSDGSGFIDFALVSRPANDDFADAVLLAGLPAAATGNSRYATAETGEPPLGSVANMHSVWWEWTAPASGTVAIGTRGSDFTARVAVFTGGSIDALVAVAADTEDEPASSQPLVFEAAAGVTYRICVFAQYPLDGWIALSVAPPTPPANDDFADAALLTGTSAEVEVGNTFATKESGEPDHAGEAGGHSVWWRWTAPADGAVGLNLVSSTFATAVGVYTGDSVGTLALVANNRASETTFWSSFGFRAVAGTTYHIAVDGQNRASGFVHLRLGPASPPYISRIEWNPELNAGATATFTIRNYGGTPPLTFEWFREGTRIEGEAGSVLTVSDVQPADAGDYTAVLSNLAGSVTSDPMHLTVRPPPTITSQPLDQTVDVGDTATLSVTATGTAPIRYHWRRNGTYIYPDTYDQATLVLTNVDRFDAGEYDVRVYYDSGPAVFSETATLTVVAASATVVLSNLEHVYDGTAKSATATTKPSGLWVVITYDGSTIAPIDAGSYAVVATVGAPDYEGSASGTLTIAKADQAIDFAALPDRTFGDAPFALGATASSGLPVALAVASGPATLDGGTLTIAGAGTVTVRASQSGNGNYNAAAPVERTFTVAKAAATVALGGLGHTYDGTAKHATATTTPAGLAVTIAYAGGSAAPTNAGSYAVLATVDEANYAGSAAGTLVIAKAAASVSITGTSQLYNGSPRPVTVTTSPAGLGLVVTYDGSTTAPTAPGGYDVVATVQDTNYAGSASATLVVESDAYLGNLSGRGAVGVGDDIIITGFALQGSGTKTLLIRGVGPALGQFGVHDVLATPTLTLVSDSGVIGSNTGWSTSPDAAAIAAASRAVYAFELAEGSADSAMLVHLPAGSYTAQLAGVGDTTGNALVELYDVDDGGGTTRLGNISVRARVATGDSILIGGYVVSGNGPRQVLVRAVGPGLARFGVHGLLADPHLGLFIGDAQVDENDDWCDSPDEVEIAAAASRVFAFELAGGSCDSAMLLTLDPGSYTVQVSGAGGTGGVALIEIYDVPMN